MDISELNGEAIYKCKKCDIFKTRDRFKKRKRCKLGIEGTCKDCINKADRERRALDPAYREARREDQRRLKRQQVSIPRVDIPRELVESLDIRVRRDGITSVGASVSVSNEVLNAILSGTLQDVEWPLFERICIYTGRHEYMDLIPELV